MTRVQRHLQAEGFLHLLAHLGQALEIATFDLGGCPAGETDLVERLANVGPRQIIVFARDVAPNPVRHGVCTANRSCASQ